MTPSFIDFDLPCVACNYNLRGLSGTGFCPECGQPVLATVDAAIARMEQQGGRPRLNWFDKVCAILAVALAVVLVLFGVVGLFVGISASFTLPPVLGIVPALVGWGILRSARVAWSSRRRDERWVKPASTIDRLPSRPVLSSERKNN